MYIYHILLRIMHSHFWLKLSGKKSCFNLIQFIYLETKRTMYCRVLFYIQILLLLSSYTVHA